MKAFLCFVALLAVVSAIQFDMGSFRIPAPVAVTEFSNFITTYQKNYDAQEFGLRFRIFQQNFEYITKFNSENTHMTLAVNQFADLTNQEFNAMYKGLNMTVTEPKDIDETEDGDNSCPTNSQSPDGAVCDWRAASPAVVTPIKNQGQCGSCWAFSTTGSTEGQHALSGQDLVSLSEQNLMDCSGSYGNMGCDGGLMDQAFQYIIGNNGIDTEESYPYTAEDGHCKFDASNVGATLSSYNDVPSGSEGGLTNKVKTVGPISVAIDASHNSFQFYSSGVYYEPDCSSQQLDHGVLAVGIGSTDGKDYYIVKNSWGTQWGSNGYILMSRNRSNNCGIATSASFPKV